MKSVEWKTYRTRFLVKAKQLSASLTFTDHLGRQHRGNKGDYLVESFEGVISIAPRQIFEDIYVSMAAGASESLPDQDPDAHPADLLFADDLRAAPLRVEKLETNFHDDEFPADLAPPKNSRVQRKSPQPVRVATSRMSLM